MDDATKLARATHLRDRALDLLKAKGQWRDIGGGKRMLELDIADLSMVCRTPLQVLLEAGKPVRNIKVTFGHNGNLPYALDIWYHRSKVLLVEWDEVEFHLVEYRPGGWEFLMFRQA